MQELFETIDIDHSGKISREELGRWLRLTLDVCYLDERSFAKEMQSVNDSALRVLRAHNLHHDEQGPLIHTDVEALLTDTVKTFFGEFDIDGNGELDFNEFSDLVTILGDEECGGLSEYLGNHDCSVFAVCAHQWAEYGICLKCGEVDTALPLT